MCPASAAGRARARGKRNICSQLSRRAQGFFTNDAGMVQRTNLGILRKLVCQKSTKFKNVWTTHSKSPIAYERGRIYFDNYRCCVSSVAAEPRKRYEMPKCSKSEKIEDALLWECPVIFELGHSPRGHCCQISSEQSHCFGTPGRHSTVCAVVLCRISSHTSLTYRNAGDQ
uniref:DDB1 and CUL4 associated factor 17 n=1 Tax=Sarcophilus harrisii TaxID=9305 RepID=A0A7N4PPZ6_SARHA